MLSSGCLRKFLLLPPKTHPRPNVRFTWPCWIYWIVEGKRVGAETLIPFIWNCSNIFLLGVYRGIFRIFFRILIPRRLSSWFVDDIIDDPCLQPRVWTASVDKNLTPFLCHTSKVCISMEYWLCTWCVQVSLVLLSISLSVHIVGWFQDQLQIG